MLLYLKYIFALKPAVQCIFSHLRDCMSLTDVNDAPLTSVTDVLIWDLLLWYYCFSSCLLFIIIFLLFADYVFKRFSYGYVHSKLNYVQLPVWRRRLHHQLILFTGFLTSWMFVGAPWLLLTVLWHHLIPAILTGASASSSFVSFFLFACFMNSSHISIDQPLSCRPFTISH